MPTKAELYAQMADKVATQLTGSWQEWAGFLTTASRLYKYPFHEQLMIYTVPVYDMERTICDLLRSRSRIEIQTFQGALKAYARRKDKNLRALMQYAGMFKVETILRQYLEVLL